MSSHLVGKLSVVRPEDATQLGEVQLTERGIRGIRYDTTFGAAPPPVRQAFDRVEDAHAWVQDNPHLPLLDTGGLTHIMGVWGVPLWVAGDQTVLGVVRQQNSQGKDFQDPQMGPDLWGMIINHDGRNKGRISAVLTDSLPNEAGHRRIAAGVRGVNRSEPRCLAGAYSEDPGRHAGAVRKILKLIGPSPLNTPPVGSHHAILAWRAQDAAFDARLEAFLSQDRPRLMAGEISREVPVPAHPVERG